VWVGVSGAAFNLSGLDDCLANGYALEHLCWYVPEYSPLVRPFVLDMHGSSGWQQVWIVLSALVLIALITSSPALEHIAGATVRAIRGTAPARGTDGRDGRSR
jgi:hypothetical protein